MKILRKIVATLFAGACLFTAQYSQARLDATDEHRRQVEANPFGRMPPAQYMAEYTASMLMGGLRAVAIDYLWIQSGKAEKSRQWIEVAALHSMILHLEPDLDEVRVHLSWVKAYNIAANMEAPEERWDWVKSGLDDDDEAVQRSPNSPKLLANKGFHLWQRVPQEKYLMDRYRSATGRDVFEVAAHTLRTAIQTAQKNDLTNTVPPADGMMQDAYFQWAFDLLYEKKFARAREVLQEGHDVYVQLMPLNRITELNERQTRLCLELIPAFRQEEALGDRDAAAKRALAGQYAALLRKFGTNKAVERRVILLLADLEWREAFDLLAAGKPAQAADALKAQVDFCGNLVAGVAGEVPQWSDMVSFLQAVQAALRSEAEGTAEPALRKYEDILEIYRYVLPGEAPQWADIEKRVKDLKPH